MKKTELKKIAYLLFLLLSTALILLMINVNKKPLYLNQCSSLINENSESKKISSQFKRVITIVDNKGFARDTGFLFEGDKKWRLNRFYTFSINLLSGNKYEIKILPSQKHFDDNVPDLTLKKFRPDHLKPINIITIEEVDPDVWLFSGLAFPLFACKEFKPD
ncbi:TPA: hypothetical protein OOF29_002728 [Morganella morganii]|nr:hypothetical protein [Morganella morganii]